MKIASIVGTRPNFVKEYLVNKALQANGVQEIIVHTGQHYDFEMSQVFFSEFQLPAPHYHLQERGSTPISHFSKMLTFLEEVLRKENPDIVIVYGDVDSTLAGAMVSCKLRIPVVHIEGGVRAQDLRNPEEINRRVADSVSTLVFASTRRDLHNLEREGFDNARAVFSGDLVWDVLKLTMEKHNIRVHSDEYALITIHRQENVESPDRLHSIVQALTALNFRAIFPLHPRTEKKMRENGLFDTLLQSEHIEIRKPMKYLDFTKLLAGASCVLTDSGGVRREAYLLGKPAVIPVDIVWFPEITEAGWNTHVECEPAAIREAMSNFRPAGPRPEIFGDGKAHEVIIKSILDRFGN